jgi:hypothetical protein
VPNPRTKKQREVNLNLLILFGEIGQMAVRSLKKKNKGII